MYANLQEKKKKKNKQADLKVGRETEKRKRIYKEDMQVANRHMTHHQSVRKCKPKSQQVIDNSQYIETT